MSTSITRDEPAIWWQLTAKNSAFSTTIYFRTKKILEVLTGRLHTPAARRDASFHYELLSKEDWIGRRLVADRFSRWKGPHLR